MFAPPSLVGTALGHGWLLEAAGADDAELFAVCVEVLEPSPGNWPARCGLDEGDALMPTVPELLSLLAEPGCGTGAVVGIVLAGTFSGSEPQPLPVPPLDEHGVSLRLVPAEVGAFATVGPVTEAELPDVVPAAVPVVVVADIDELFWA